MKKKDVVPAANKDEIVVYQPEGAEFHIDWPLEWLSRNSFSPMDFEHSEGF